VKLCINVQLSDNSFKLQVNSIILSGLTALNTNQPVLVVVQSWYDSGIFVSQVNTSFDADRIVSSAVSDKSVATILGSAITYAVHHVENVVIIQL